jgi:hypothetical protein
VMTATPLSMLTVLTSLVLLDMRDPGSTLR